MLPLPGTNATAWGGKSGHRAPSSELEFSPDDWYQRYFGVHTEVARLELFFNVMIRKFLVSGSVRVTAKILGF